MARLLFEVSEKSGKPYHSAAQMKRNERYVLGKIDRLEKFGRNKLCSCGSCCLFQATLSEAKALYRR